MPPATNTKLNRAIDAYYESLKAYSALNKKHETGIRQAFLRLLEDASKLQDEPQKWTLVAEVSSKVDKHIIRPDATVYKNAMPRGYWEAKDTSDDLEVEIKKKIAKGYPLDNIIFEDTRTAILYQNGSRQYALDMTDAANVARLLNDFYRYTTPVLEKYDAALEAFSGDIPRLARGLQAILETAHQNNQAFIAAFKDFFALCQASLNPNISQKAVDEMLVQHLLTERLFRKIFDNPDFSNRNVIAAEVEKVIRALTSASFSRDSYLRELDSYYTAIETAAHGLEFSRKQELLNTVYERFFQGYDKNVADTHGIVYTPQPIVDFMCASVVEVLQTEFGKSLGDDDVVILDPATGTGNFIVNLLRRVPARDLEATYKHRLFANEIMLLPYYIASMNIEHTYLERTGTYAPFEGLCFVDTLDLAEGKQMRLDFMTAANSARVERQKKAPITVIIANPPYNVGQESENDNNKNRPYDVIEKRIKETYVKDSRAGRKAQLYDPYVKFFRWAIDRLQDRDGIVCMVTNNSFVDQLAFDGMRKHLLQDFTQIYHIDLHGNVRQNPKLSGTTHNVFGIQVGVGITIAIKRSIHADHKLHYFRVAADWRKEEKFSWLSETGKVSGVQWQELVPDTRNTWLIPENAQDFTAMIPIGVKEIRGNQGSSSEAIFKAYCLGIATNRDNTVYDFEASVLLQRMKHFIDLYNIEVDRYKRATTKAKENIDDFVNYEHIKWDGTLKSRLADGRIGEWNASKIRNALYRPFTKNKIYFDRLFLNSVYLQPYFFPTPETETENRIIWIKVGSDWPMFALVANTIVDLLPQGGSQCFPFYTYDPDGTNRRENITDWALAQFRSHYTDESISKWDIFYYVYGLLHHPDYRTKFADNLKRDLPRIPFAPGVESLRVFADAGKQLADLHLNYETVKPHRLRWIEAKDVPLSYRVEKMRLSKDKTQLVVNDFLTLADIPAAVYNYRLGNRSALEWIIDQYQVSTDKRSGITSDPNRADNPRYIVDLVERIVTVSLDTVRIVAALPIDYTTVKDKVEIITT